MIYLYVAIGILAALLALTRTPWFKGWAGEFYVNLGTRLLLDKSRYHLLRNITLPAEEGTMQIDHVVVSRYGIFVVETKNMNGAIFGGEHDGQWTQAIGRRKFQFQNPLRQNYKHTRTLAEILGVPHDKMKSIVMFIGDAKLRTREKLPANVMANGFAAYIKSHKEEILTEAEVRGVLAKIEECRLARGITTHLEHVRHVHEITERKGALKPRSSAAPGALTFQEGATPCSAAAAAPSLKANADQTPVCPLCGNAMVLRVAGKGPHRGRKFWGCSAYPKCRGTIEAAL